MKYSLIIAFCFLSVFYSCTEDASEEVYARLPEYVQKLALTAYVSPDQKQNEVYVTTNLPRFGERIFKDLGNLSFNLYENLNEVTIDTVCKQRDGINYHYYITNFRFKEGCKYTLKVSSDAGFEASASCRIPIRHDFDIRVDTSSRKTIDEQGRHLLIPCASVSIRDFPGERNFYRMLLSYKAYGKQLKATYSKLSGPPVATKWQWDAGDIVYNDYDRDGERIILRLIEFDAIDPESTLKNAEPDSAYLRIYLLNTDKPYYDFHASLLDYTTGDDPFTEPSLLYSNVDGGLGIFASYVVDSLIYRIK